MLAGGQPASDLLALFCAGLTGGPRGLAVVLTSTG